ncbi:hypothetical protein OTU49_006734 [Cherax quadricarinatus]|uniref:Uncharacterized protein n=1 Tax=Cherax quadricarinatus TaxID=27406 RepID=A0AAW0WLN4_CHEQU
MKGKASVLSNTCTICVLGTYSIYVLYVPWAHTVYMYCMCPGHNRDYGCHFLLAVPEEQLQDACKRSLTYKHPNHDDPHLQTQSKRLDRENIYEWQFAVTNLWHNYPFYYCFVENNMSRVASNGFLSWNTRNATYL